MNWEVTREWPGEMLNRKTKNLRPTHQPDIQNAFQDWNNEWKKRIGLGKGVGKWEYWR